MVVCDMSFKSKNFTLYLIVMLVASCVLLAVEPCVAPELTKPDIPIFAIEYTESIDFTNGHLHLNITHQSFTPYTDDGSEVNLYYEAQIRKQGWIDFPWTPVINTRPYIEQSNAQYTIIDLPISQSLDVRVRALIGSLSTPFEFKGVEGDWSYILVTINRPTSSPVSSLPSNTSPADMNPLLPSPLEPDFDDKVVWSIAGIMLLAVVLGVGVVVLVIIAVVFLLRRGTKA
jgi:hypothetical protein